MPQTSDLSWLPDPPGRVPTQPPATAPQRLDLSWLPDPPADEPSTLRSVLATGARIVPSVGGALLGAPGGPLGMAAGGAIGAGVGEVLGELVEGRDEINPAQVAAQTVLGALPIGKLKAGAPLVRRLLSGGAQGAALGGGAAAITDLAEGERPTLEGVATGAALGSVFGAGTAGVAGGRRLVGDGRARVSAPSTTAPAALTTETRGTIASLADAAQTSAPTGAGRVAGLNVDRLAPDVRAPLQTLLSDPQHAAFFAEQRGTRTLDEIRAGAAARGVTLDDVIAPAEKGIGFESAEHAVAFRDVAVQQFRHSLDTFRRFKETGSAADLVDAHRALTEMRLVAGSVLQKQSEAGRTLRVLREVADGTLNVRDLQRLDDLTGKDEDLIRKLATLGDGDTAAAHRMARDVSKGDQVFEAWINGLLSGPVTHAANAISNSATALLLPVERGLSAGADLVRATVTGTGRERFFRESTVAASGLVRAIPAAFGRALRAFDSELSSFGPPRLAETGARQGGAIRGRTGRFVRVPSRVLLAGDEFFKTIVATATRESAATKDALQRGLRPADPAFAAHVDRLVAEPPAWLKDAARREAAYRTFTNDLGKAGRGLVHLRGAVPGGRWIVPFLRTPINIARFGVERTPLTLPLVLKRAATGELQGAELSDAVAKQAMGISLALGIGAGYEAGVITGGGSPDPMRRRLEHAAAPPYSIRIGETWYSYRRIEPLGMVVGLTADFLDAFHHQARDGASLTELPGQLVGALAQNLTSKTFLSGISDLFEALRDPERYGERWVSRAVGSVVPTGIAQVARTMDPTLRAAETPLEAMQARVPGLRSSLPAVRDVFGEPRQTEGGALARLLSPMPTQAARDATVPAALLRADVPLGAPLQGPRTLSVNGEAVEIPADLRDALAATRGRSTKTVLDAVVKAPGFARLPVPIQAEILTRLRDRVGRAVNDAGRATLRTRRANAESNVRILQGIRQRFDSVPVD